MRHQNPESGRFAIKMWIPSYLYYLVNTLSPLQFNSMVLYCVPKLRLIGQKFSVREKMDIAGLQVSIYYLCLRLFHQPLITVLYGQKGSGALASG